ncbi:S41 family peptidase [Cellvibrio japonicus]|uniref:Carboxyl-terminal protease n=1 Tax=Cellvibrio japonicus (strain Ueda107) TaxID=498211 RepID=B3PGV6_CELJU|nr:S41 family peptidase [Cellvibrio japonicus]ACE85104.1 carboxyl-terminal protease [Cellvibrio japonicus Ueda107]
MLCALLTPACKPARLLMVLACMAAPLWVSPLSAQDTGSQSAEQSPPALLPLEDLRTFTRVYDQIRNGYVEEISDSQLLEYAIRGMIAELDPHSAYLGKDAFADLQANTSGEFGGVGLEVSLEDGFVKVVTPIDDSPSARAGILSGDVIIRLDDQPVKGMDLNKAVNMMRGPKGSKIKLGVMRQGVDQPIDFELVRDIIKVQSIRTRVLEDDYFYIRISQFQLNTGTEMLQKLRIHLEKNPKTKGIVLDLRNNPGGVLQSSVEVADAFLDGGMVVYTQGRLENSNIHYNAEAGDLANGLPLVVLINDGSASASEIVAGALQDHKRAVIMGTRSFGKGSVQTVIPISQDRAVKLTTALYYTPLGRSIQAQGIEPDVEVERVKIAEISTVQGTTEADLAGHLNRKDGRESNSKSRQEKRITSAQLLKEDNQLHEALNLLKGLHIFIQSSPVKQPEPAPAQPAPAIAPDISITPDLGSEQSTPRP